MGSHHMLADGMIMAKRDGDDREPAHTKRKGDIGHAPYTQRWSIGEPAALLPQHSIML